MKLINRIILFFVCIFLINLSFAEEGQNKVIVGYYENEVFQEGAEEGAVKRGYAYEYYQKLSEYTGWKYEYVYGNFSELYSMLLDGKIDLLAGLAWKKERESLISYPSYSMGVEKYALLRHRQDTDVTNEIQSFSHKKIGVLESAMVDSLKNYLAAGKVNAVVETFNTYEDLFSAFDNKEIDILATEGDGTYSKHNAELLCYFGSTDYFLCVNKKRPDLLKQLNQAQALIDVEEPNYLSNLRSKYYHSTVSGRALTGAEKNWIENHPLLRVGYLENYLPYSGTDAMGNVTGIVKDVFSRMAGSLGLSQKAIIYLSYDNYYDMIEAMSRNEVDVVFPVGGGLYYSEKNGIYQSQPLIQSSIYLVSAAKSGNHVFAVNRNNAMQSYYIKTYFPEARIIEYENIEECLDAVRNRVVDCTTVNGLRSDILRSREYKKLFVRQLISADSRCFGVNIGNEGLLKLLNRGINMVGTEFAQNLAYRYTEGLYNYRISDFLMDNILFVILMILAAVLTGIFFIVRDANHSKKALAAVESANKAKTLFLDNMSYDIQTPMNSIIGFTSLASASINKKEKLLDYLKQITVSSEHLFAIINNILDISRIESQTVFLNEDEINFPAFVADITSILSQSLKEKNLDLTFKQNITNPNIIADKLRLQQVLLNILGNAIKFTPYGGKIYLTINELKSDEKIDSEQKSHFEIIIKDTGIGMSEEFLNVIFEPFVRDKSVINQKVQGSGLGLAISKRIVKLMGGDIFVTSKEGMGSEFIIELPLTICEFAVMQEEKKSTRVDFSGKRVLVCEDVETNQIITRDMLENSGFLVELARDGVEALEKIKLSPESYYDVIIMETRLPVMNGYEAAKQIRVLSDRKKALIPIIAVSSNAYGDDRARIFECGMNAYLTKPFNIPSLISALKGVVTR
ncbi:ATP-binding protein [Treponema sp. C6A8]|uniref:ATP-binding protein n=1 Tax=Treponema sp. C6A8 TaxID=1410609 RepID=UPI0004898B5D|nr:transporter substrate-binding domain-containing protein [Treponema sp. C6A8]